MAARQIAARFLACVLLALPPAAAAAELGALSVRSRLGQPLDARVEILSLQPGEESTLAARLASRAAFRSAGVEYHASVSAVRASIERVRGRSFVRLRSTRAIQEPFLHVLLQLQSSAGARARAYTLLLDPVGYRPPPATAAPAPAVPSAPAPSSSRDELFGVDKPAAPAAVETRTVVWRGFVQAYTAYDYQDPSHWSRAVIRTQLGAQGARPGFKWKASFRLDVDPLYAGSDFYPPEVRKDQRRDLFVRETYVDTSAGGLELRLGKQHIVWGEMVGLFFADVVSARDQRDFILPEFEIIRIPQWALRAERFGDNAHAELIWLPFPEVDIIGKPGAEFYPLQEPAPAGFDPRFENAVRPARSLRNSNFGARVSGLTKGWDLSAFYYRSTDVNPTFYREVALSPGPTVTFTPRHDRIWQVGVTAAKDFRATVLKGEVIYASGRKFNVTRLDQPDGVVPQQTLDYVVGLDFLLPRETRLNLQYFERVYFDHDPELLHERREGGISLLASGRLGARLAPEVLLLQSVNRRDRLVRTRLGWTPTAHWRFTLGVDVFSGPPTGFFGRFADNDRVYLESRYDF